MLLSVVVWITSCQNNFVSYLDTIGQTPELMNRVTLWSRYIEVGCILAIVSTGLAYIAYGMETCILNVITSIIFILPEIATESLYHSEH